MIKFLLAALAKTENLAEILRKFAKHVENISDQQMQCNIAAATAIISGIAKEIIQRLPKE
jgi:hypothetical protein